jgi:hypothetical protein
MALLSLARISIKPLQSRCFSTRAIQPAEAQFDHVVIGAGVVGLAVAARLAKHVRNPMSCLTSTQMGLTICVVLLILLLVGFRADNR